MTQLVIDKKELDKYLRGKNLKRPKSKAPVPAKHYVNCVSCGTRFEINPEEAKIPLQCGDCKENKVVIPRGYKELSPVYETGIHIEDVENESTD